MRRMYTEKEIQKIAGGGQGGGGDTVTGVSAAMNGNNLTVTVNTDKGAKSSAPVALYKTETWTFVTKDNVTVTKTVVVK